MLDSLVEEELKRQKTKAKETKRKNQPPKLMSQSLADNGNRTGPQETLAFDQQISYVDAVGNPISFQAVAGKSMIRM